MSHDPVASRLTGLEVAIVGMAGRFPRANDIDAFWQNLRDGIETISFFSDDEVLASGIDPAVLRHPNYVKAGGVLEGVELFDAAFFGYSPREAEILDPQHRLFLECAWEALEHAGYDADRFDRPVGVYAGAGLNGYLFSNLLINRESLAGSVGTFQAILGNERDHLTTTVSYKLNLKGPSLTVQTACSTSLVAVHLACQGLLSGDCDMALAGAVSIAVPQKAGYLYQPGGVLSPDGHCRAFDAGAQGTVNGSGLGIVVLKRLTDALTDRDRIYAVIKGTAINNDGAQKVGYTAPSVEGQARVIRAAHLMAEVDASTLTYIETHGTGTVLGDPIEMAALNQVIRASTDARQFCAIGSVKTNIGHLDPAAGIAGLIKTVLALEHKLLPPSLNFVQPNPQIDFEQSPFYVNTTLAEWKTEDPTPRRAGVSSFGIGGTNAHIVLEEAPPVTGDPDPRPWQTLLLSAKTRSALEAATSRLAQHLRQHPDLNLADVSYTLQVGRKAFDYRRAAVCRDTADAIEALSAQDSQQILSSRVEQAQRPVAFLFPGQGTQYVNMTGSLYEVEPVFRQHVDRCAEILAPHLELDLRRVLYAESAAEQLEQTWLTQPALFTVEYALAQLWLSAGVQPQAMLGHSIGEYVAACLAGVFSLEEALALVAARGRLMQSLPGGAMLAVLLSSQEAGQFLSDEISLAAVNGPALCVLAGPVEPITALQTTLAGQGVNCQRLHTSHAFHSAMMNPIVESFAEQLRKVKLQPPQMPYISNLTGNWITAAEATDPHYWARHLRQTVQFADGVSTLLQTPDLILLEVGPGRTLTSLVHQHPAAAAGQLLLTSVRHPRERQSDVAFFQTALARLWLAGCEVNWSAFHTDCHRCRVALPTYPFERRRYWIEPKGRAGPAVTQPESLTAAHDLLPDAESPRPVADGASRHPRPNLQNEYAPPGSEIERQVAETWQKALGIDLIGIHDNFFELGGHSLLAVQLLSQLRELFVVDLAFTDIFEAPTVAGVAAVIARKQVEQTDDTLLAQVMAEVAQLSGEELQAMLEAEQ